MVKESLLSPKLLAEIVAHAEQSYPAECCGALVLRGGRPTVQHVDNVYDRYHARDPETYPRTSGTAYLMDPRQAYALMEKAQKGEEQVLCIYHSHVDAGAYFSAEDKAVALAEGKPLWPDAEYLVVSVRQGKALEAAAFRFDGQDFRGRPVALPPG